MAFFYVLKRVKNCLPLKFVHSRGKYVVNILLDIQRLTKGDNTLQNALQMRKQDENITHIKLDDLLQRNDIKLELIQIGKYSYDLIEKRRTWSPETFDILGVDHSVDIQSLDFYQMVHPDEREHLDKHHKRCMEIGETYVVEYRILSREGQVRFIRDECFFITNEKNEVIQINGTVEDITHQQTRLQHDSEQEIYTKFLFDHNPDMIAHLDLNGIFVHCNPALEATLGYTKEELFGSSFVPLIHPEDIEVTWHHFQSGRNGLTKEYDIRLTNKNGEVIHGHVTCIPIIKDLHVTGLFVIVKNVTKTVLIQKELQDSELKYRSIVENSNMGVYIAVNGSFAYTNHQLNAILDFPSLTNLSVMERVHAEDRARVLAVIKQLDMGESERNLVCRAIKKDGSIIKIEIHFSRISYQGELAFLGTVLDINEKEKLYEHNEYLAYHDSLTGLPNRRMLEKELDRQLSLSRDSQQPFVVMALDLDRFKYINDSLGHLAGDVLLKMVAKRWKWCLPEESLVARIGGDEFFVVLPNVTDLVAVEGVAQTIIEQMSEPFFYQKHEFTVTASVGITLFPQHGDDAQTLIKNADIALFKAKENGKNGYQVFSSSMNEMTCKTFLMENDMRQAIRDEQFEVYFQPRVDCNGHILSAEALIRWHHPHKGFISPGEFIPIAEETGLIFAIGNWVMESVCHLIKDSQNRGLPIVPISINLSAKQFVQKDFVNTVRSVLEETGLDPAYLEIEITEGSFILDEKRVQQALRDLKEIGVKVALDDFGTGYSSLSYLTKFKDLITTLKIDGSFFTNFTEDDQNIISLILHLAKQLKMNVVAEGIETIEQLEFLKVENCDEVQGYLFSKPVPFGDFTVLLNQGKLE